jgi:RIO kinase 1
MESSALTKIISIGDDNLESKNNDVDTNGDSDIERQNRKRQEEEGRREVDEAVFMQAYIPTSLHEISNPYAEMDRIKSGQREPGFEAAVNRMLGGTVVTIPNTNISSLETEIRDNNIDATTISSSTGIHIETNDEIVVSLLREKPSSIEEENIDETEEDEVSDSEEGDEDSESEESSKYRKQLPSRDDPQQRQIEKVARKQARRVSKLEKAVKRQSKIPKHQKKRAVKAGKK